MIGRCKLVLIAAAVATLALPGVANAAFGIVPGSVGAVAENSDGTIDTQASSHPFSYTVSFQLNTDAEGNSEGGELRDVIVTLPPGLVGDPLAVPTCPRQQFEGLAPQCSPTTQLGVLHVNIPGVGQAAGPVYNVAPPPGVAAQIGFSAVGLNGLLNATVAPAGGYPVIVSAGSIPLEVTSTSVTIWGVPADPSHDPERGAHGNTSAEAPLLPYLTLPASCETPLVTTVEVDSKLDPGHFIGESVESLGSGGNPAPLSGCEQVPFAPQVVATPTSRAAESASGLDFELSLPDEGLLNPYGIAESEPEKIEVALPEGVTANPSSAAGLAGCSEAQFDAEQLHTAPGDGCPEASKVGTLVAHTPLIGETIEGSLYMATPYENPSGTLIGLYIVARAAERGVLIKQAGKVEPNPVTGQLVTTFEGLPPLPYAGFRLSFREGARSLLVTPPACGAYQTIAKLTPFSRPASAYTVNASFQIDHGVQGGACPSAGVPPFKPSVVAGTENNAAGSYSPLYMRIERRDGEQEITGFSTQLPPGVTGNLSGVPFCAEAEIQRAREQTGAQAEASPACPAASQIGTTISEAGVGGVLAQTPGKLYLAGPFEGAPFSVVDITSAKVGPFDLGTVVVHLPLMVDPVTAQVSIPPGPADQIPHIIKGIVIHLRTIRVYVGRERFMLNPTSCEPMSLSATVIGSGASFVSPADDVPATVNDRFQAADCASLAFKPAFKVSTSAKTSRKDGASLTVSLTYPKEALGKDANIHEVKVELPKALPSRLSTLQRACTEAQFDANPAGCPAESVVGHVKAMTPILPVPLEGPAYFVSRGAKWPELIIVLQGYGVTIDLHGETHISKAGVTSSTFSTVPDQPVESFQLTLPEGPYSALAAPGGKLCKKKLTMPTSFLGQNGASVKQKTKIKVTGCKATRKKHHKTKEKRHRTGRRHHGKKGHKKNAGGGNGKQAQRRRPK